MRTTKPLYWFGSVADEIELRFEQGKVVEARAGRGEEFIRSKLATDESAAYLGEVALVDGTSRIGQRNLLFKNGLLDENAVPHRDRQRLHGADRRGAEKLSDEERQAAGINVSQIHIDLMIGSNEVKRRRSRRRVIGANSPRRRLGAQLVATAPPLVRGGCCRACAWGRPRASKDTLRGR